MDPNEDSDDILRANRSREKTFHFDVAFSEETTQQDVYQSTVVDRDIIGKVISGYNCTVFAYGATGERGEPCLSTQWRVLISLVSSFCFFLSIISMQQ